jgi:hypothetical protein
MTATRMTFPALAGDLHPAAVPDHTQPEESA